MTLESPEELATVFGARPAGLSRAAVEALTLEALWADKVTVAQARRLLGISSRYEMDGSLKPHGILLSLSLADIEQDAATALQFRVRSRS